MSYLGVLPFYITLVSSLPCIHVYENIYILEIFTEKGYSKALEFDTVYFTIQLTLVISKSKGPSKTLRDIRTSTYQWGGRVVRWSWVNFQCRGVLLVWIRVGQGPTALAVGAGGGCLDIFTLVYPFSALSPSLWETTRYRLKYCLKGSLSPKTTKSTYQMCSSEEKTIWTTKIYKWLCNLTPLLRNIYWKYCGKGEKLLPRSNFSSFPQYFVTWF